MTACRLFPFFEACPAQVPLTIWSYLDVLQHTLLALLVHKETDPEMPGKLVGRADTAVMGLWAAENFCIPTLMGQWVVGNFSPSDGTMSCREFVHCYSGAVSCREFVHSPSAVERLCSLVTAPEPLSPAGSQRTVPWATQTHTGWECGHLIITGCPLSGTPKRGWKPV